MSDFNLVPGNPFGWTNRDAINALRAGGPMDKIGVQLVCPKCGLLHQGSLRWFHARDNRCGCGTLLLTSASGFARAIDHYAAAGEFLPPLYPVDEHGRDD